VSGLQGLRRAIARGALVLMALGLAGCGDLLQEPDTGTGIATLVTVTVVSGNGQVGTPGAALPQPVRARLIAQEGGPTERLWVEWVVLEGAGTASPRHSFTDADGIAETTWILGPGPGRQRLQGRFARESATFEAQLAGN